MKPFNPPGCLRAPCLRQSEEEEQTWSVKHHRLFRMKAEGGESQCTWLDPARSFLRASPLLSALHPLARPELSQAGAHAYGLLSPWTQSLPGPGVLPARPPLPSPRLFSEGPAPCCASRVNHLQDQPRFSPASTLPLTHLLRRMVAGTASLARGQTGARAHVERGEGGTAHRLQCRCFIIRPSDDRTDGTYHHTRPFRA